jgi:hypothetical protein
LLIVTTDLAVETILALSKAEINIHGGIIHNLKKDAIK